ncbi:MAG: CCA tRNA nucleotidyltransferase, partial [Terriglobales bacterium]
MLTAKQHAANIVRTLRARGHQAYFAGGCVRDLLLGREPADYDVSTDATPQQVMQVFPQTFAVGEQFGVVLVPEPSGATGVPSTGSGQALARQGERGKGAIEVATFRSDMGYSDGRHPDQVRFTKDPREDVERRDFTINGMMLDPLVFDKTTNEILDFVGGREDLKAGIVRAIGDPERRFAEDKLRMLRAVRFAARFDYKIDPATMAAIQKLAPKIHQVSSERVREELTKMLTEGRARRAFELLDSTGLLPEVLPEISAMKGVEQPPQYHPEGDVFVHTLLL